LNEPNVIEVIQQSYGGSCDQVDGLTERHARLMWYKKLGFPLVPTVNRRLYGGGRAVLDRSGMDEKWPFTGKIPKSHSASSFTYDEGVNLVQDSMA